MNGLKKASNMGLTNIGLTGLDGGEMKKYCKTMLLIAYISKKSSIYQRN